MSSQVIVTATATKHIAVYVAATHPYVCLTRTIDALQFIIGTTGFLFHVTASDGRNLTAAEDAVAYISAIDGYIRLIDGTVVDITAAEHTAGFFQERIG